MRKKKCKNESDVKEWNSESENKDNDEIFHIRTNARKIDGWWFEYENVIKENTCKREERSHSDEVENHKVSANVNSFLM